MSYNDDQVKKARHLKLVVNNGPVTLTNPPNDNEGLSYEQQRAIRERIKREQNARARRNLTKRKPTHNQD